MIVVDTNIIASLVLPTSKYTKLAMRLLEKHRDWASPTLWRSEFCNILATGVKNRWFRADQAFEALATAEEVMEGGEYMVPASEVVKTAVESGCTAYDSEFVVLARDFSVPLVTLDSAILKAFPSIATSLHEFSSKGAS